MRPSEAAEIVMMLMAAYPQSKTQDTTSAVYETLLGDLNVDLARKAVTRLIATRKWLPTIAEIRAAAAELRLGPVRDGGEAWKDALAAARHVGRYDAPAFNDPLVAEALKLWGSWTSFCDSPEDDPGGRARFIELYDSLAARKREAEASGIPLPEPKSSPAISPPSRKPEPLPPVVPMAIELMSFTSQPRPRHPDPTPRKYTAEELDHALEARK